jgi:hypothetical protein
MKISHSFKNMLTKSSSFTMLEGVVSGSSRNLMSLLQRENESSMSSSRENLSNDSPLVRALSSSSSDTAHNNNNESNNNTLLPATINISRMSSGCGSAICDQKSLDDYKIVKTKVYGKLPQICLILGKAFESRNGLQLPTFNVEEIDILLLIKARKEMQRHGITNVSGDGNMILALLLDFFESLIPSDACLSSFSTGEMNLMATVLNKRDREGEDCYVRVTSDLANKAPLQRNIFVWLVDFLATIAGTSDKKIIQLAQKFGPVIWQRQHDIRLLHPSEMERAELDSKTILAACIYYARRSRKSGEDDDYKIGQPF